jgi:hypothetical protein
MENVVTNMHSSITHSERFNTVKMEILYFKIQFILHCKHTHTHSLHYKNQLLLYREITVIVLRIV